MASSAQTLTTALDAAGSHGRRTAEWPGPYPLVIGRMVLHGEENSIMEGVKGTSYGSRSLRQRSMGTDFISAAKIIHSGFYIYVEFMVGLELERQAMAVAKGDDHKQVVVYMQTKGYDPPKDGVFADRAQAFVDQAKNAIPEVPNRVDGLSPDEGDLYNKPVMAVGKTDSGTKLGTDCPDTWHQTTIRQPSGFDQRAEGDEFQIFVKSMSGKSMVVWVSVEDTGETLESKIVQKEGFLSTSFYILHEGKVLNKGDKLRDRQIQQNATIHLRYRLRGGTNGNRRTAGPSSYKDTTRSKGPHASATPPSTQPKGPHASAVPLPTEPRPYIVEKLDDIPALEVKITEGPWFWGRAGLFITPWYPEFDADTMVVTKMPVWVRLPNLPLPFWHHEVLEDIGNLLGKYIISDSDRKEQGLFTYARICVEIDLSKGLPDKIQLQHETFKRIQALDYENTAFRCRSCNMTGHLHDSCPHARRFPKKKKGLNPKRKTWQAEYDPSINEESKCEESDTEGKQREEENEEAAPFSETREAKNSDPKKVEPKNEGEEPQSDSGNHMADKDDSSPREGTQTTLVIHEGVPTGGIKRGHESEKSDSDKEQPSIRNQRW